MTPSTSDKFARSNEFEARLRESSGFVPLVSAPSVSWRRDIRFGRGPEQVVGYSVRTAQGTAGRGVA